MNRNCVITLLFSSIFLINTAPWGSRILSAGVVCFPDLIECSINRAVGFLANEQLNWGEFATYSFEKKDMSYRKYTHSVFITTFVLHSLNYIEQTQIVRDMIDRAVNYLLDNKEGIGLYRFFGKGSYIYPDMDDISCALAALYQHDIPIEPGLPEYFLQFRNKKSNLFYTWLKEPLTKGNDIDCIVNANTLFFYALMNQSDLIPEVSNYLISQSSKLGQQKCQKWYSSPQAFTYTVSRAYADGRAKNLVKASLHISDFLLSTQRKDGSWGNELETALASVSLININYSGIQLDKAIQFLLSHQNDNDGSWPAAFFFLGPLGYYGSEELTTAISLEALAKYKKANF